MKIFFLLTQDLESPSGLGRYYPLARELASLGHNVSVYALHPNYEKLATKEWTQGRLRVVYCAPMHVRKTGNTKTYYGPFRLGFIVLRATWSLTLAVMQERPDLIWVGKPHPMNGIAGILAKWRWGSQLFLDCDDNEAGSGNFQSVWQSKLIGWFETHLPRFADRVTTNTHYSLDTMASRGISRTKLYYLPNGVDLERFAILPHKSEVEALKIRLGLEGKKVISYIGSLSLASHAVDLLVDAFCIIHQHNPNTRLLLVGSGEDYQRLRDYVSACGMTTSVVFTGRIPPHQIPLYYRASKVTADPVYNNDAARGRSPLKMFEAWACEVPFVTSTVGDRSALAGDPPAALLVAPGDFKSLADALEMMLDEEFCMQFVLNGRRKVKEYSWDKIVSRINLGNHE